MTMNLNSRDEVITQKKRNAYKFLKIATFWFKRESSIGKLLTSKV